MNIVVKNLVPRAEAVKLPTGKKTRFGKTKILCQVLRQRISLLVRKLGVVRTKTTISPKKKMLKIIFYLSFLTILIYGFSYFKNDKAKDEPAKPIGDYFHNKMKTINENYKDNIDEDIANLRNFGHLENLSLMFVRIAADL